MQRTEAQIGVAARALMGFAFDDARGGGMMPLAIGFVGRTFGTDSSASKQAIARLLEPSRMADHAADDMHWLAQEVGRISKFDPELAVSIYEAIFRYVIDEERPTRLGNSQILPLTSNSRQDFKMAQWSLKEAYPDFFKRNPKVATRAAIAVAQAYRDTSHALREPSDRQSIKVGDVEAGLINDLSYIWAASHRATYSDDAREIIDAFVDRVLALDEPDALEVIAIVISSSDVAWLWARLFMIGARRGGEVAKALWPWASQMPFLRSTDTLKDAIDLIAAGYADRSEAEKATFEDAVMGQALPTADIPEKRELQFKRRVFGAIGLAKLATPDARRIVEAAELEQQAEPNERLYEEVEAYDIEAPEFHHLRSAGVDTKALQNVPVLDAIRMVDTKTVAGQSAAASIDVVALLVAQLVGSPPVVDDLVRSYGWETAARALESATHEFAAVKALNSGQTAALGALVAQFPNKSDGEGGASEVTRESLAGLVLNLARVDSAVATRFADMISGFAHDEGVFVRNAVAARLHYLWDSNRDLAWKLADYFASNEVNTYVLINVGSFGSRLMGADLDGAQTLVLGLVARVDGFAEPARSEVLDQFGSIVFRLWTRHGQQEAREVLDHWLASRDAYKGALGGGAFSIRWGLTVAYESEDPGQISASKRCLALAYEIIDRAATGLETYIAAEPATRTPDMDKSASSDAMLLDKMASQFLFAVGPTEIREGGEPRTLLSAQSRQAFVSDNARTFMRIGDAGTPKTIYYLLQLMEFLAPSNPALVFDIVAHAVTGGGRAHSFQMESLGAARFVKLVGSMIADHRVIFEEQQRRLTLVEILELFVEVGWPDARRLLYKLPEALR